MSTEIAPLELLRRAGLRSTPQRVAIVREVYARNHPSVGEVYDAVKAQFPTIGLATVYNTLRTMTDKGFVRELPFSNLTRFEINMEPHANLVCQQCGAIEDWFAFSASNVNSSLSTKEWIIFWIFR